MYVYKVFSTTLDKGLTKNIKNKEEMEKLENINKMKWEFWIWNRKSETSEIKVKGHRIVQLILNMTAH